MGCEVIVKCKCLYSCTPATPELLQLLNSKLRIKD